MSKQKDLKRLIRARMRKTGETYTTARSHLVSKATKPASSDFAKIAGISDAAVRVKTGRPWQAWVAALDRAGARRMTHRDIARFVQTFDGVTRWWAQAVTVGYERIRGLRAIGQRRDGSFEVNKSRTFAVPVERVYRAFSEKRTRGRWLDAEPIIRTSTRNESVRMTWPDGTSVEVQCARKAAAKSQVVIQHRKLPDQATVVRMKRYWGERLDALASVLSPS